MLNEELTDCQIPCRGVSSPGGYVSTAKLGIQDFGLAFLNLDHLDLFRISVFEFRISSIMCCQMTRLTES